MNYFEILDLRMEPFSNSPDPDFLYRSEGHERCLHTLEIAIRLRRGLSVVLGKVGTGKTTLCRELIRTLEEDESATARLLLDPGFSSARELLLVLHEIFCGPVAGEPSDWQLKERIKDTILTTGLDQEKILVLVVDEGQKMPPHCLEILRELLNYETNKRKLLQIVIFAQSEFSETLAAMPNLADRVNDLIKLGPLTLAETKAMVRHRLDMAKADYRAPEIFTALGYLALHRITGGYPRRVVRLCHKVVLGLIMSRQRKAGWRQVRACARDNEMAPKGSRRWLAVPVATGVLALLWLALLGLPPEMKAQLRRTVAPLSAQALPSTPVLVAAPEPEPQDAPARSAGTTGAAQSTATQFMAAQPAADAARSASAAAQPRPAAAKPLAPALLGRATVLKHESLSTLVKAVYGRFDPSLLETVFKANPGMTDPNLVQVGQEVFFPVVEVGTAPAYWVQVDDKRELAAALDLWRTLPSVAEARVLPHLDETGAHRFAVICGGPCLSEPEARRILDRNLLPGTTLAQGDVLVRLQW